MQIFDIAAALVAARRAVTFFDAFIGLNERYNLETISPASFSVNASVLREKAMSQNPAPGNTWLDALFVAMIVVSATGLLYVLLHQ